MIRKKLSNFFYKGLLFFKLFPDLTKVNKIDNSNLKSHDLTKFSNTNHNSIKNSNIYSLINNKTHINGIDGHYIPMESSTDIIITNFILRS